MRPFVIIESPYAAKNTKDRIWFGQYLRAAMLDSVRRGESPFASHYFYTEIGLNDLDPADRQLGMEAGWALYAKADICAVYLDCGLSRGMTEGINRAIEHNVQIDWRNIGWPVSSTRTLSDPASRQEDRLLLTPPKESKP